MIRIALPTGELRAETAALLERAGVGIGGYAGGSRALRFEALGGTGVARVFREKDIPVQVAMGNYDVGICGLAWVEELAQRFPAHGVARLAELGFGASGLWLAAGGDSCAPSVRIASEYANIADALARKMRLRRYRIFPVWGAAEAYPPEDADVALVDAVDEDAVCAHGLRPLARVLATSAWLIANRGSMASKDLSPLLSRLLGSAPAAAHSSTLAVPEALPLRVRETAARRNVIRLALPDGHQLPHAVAALDAAGLALDGYSGDALVRRPRIDCPGIEVKVIRPQDMPQQVAVGNFDLAVTGRDRLFDHKVQFPSSPVEEAADLGRAPYGLAAIVKDVPADSIAEALAYWRRDDGARTVRLASELPNIADHFARERHLGRYSVIPIAGASEGFVPEDADILIEGMETGSSVRANKLTVLERFFESTNCLIASTQRPGGRLGETMDAFIAKMRAGAREAVAAGGGA
jgi:ATP phosphoribosyltransferase